MMISNAAPAAGAATGSGLLGALGRLLEPLDYPRQALYNLGSGLAEGDLWKALPGLIGAGVAAPLIATGVGAPLGILAGSLAGGLAQGVAGKEAPTTGDLVEKLGGDKESFLQNLAVGAVTDPLTYAGGLGGLRAGTAASKAGESAYGALKPLREQFGVVKGVRQLDTPEQIAKLAALEESGGMGRVISTAHDQPLVGLATGGTISGNERAMGRLADMATESGFRTDGMYDPGLRAAAIIEGADPKVARHETIHGLIDTASRTGEYGGMPLAMQVPARLIRSPFKFTRGLGEVADETVAHALENRGLWDQLGGAYRFLSNPQRGYAKQFEQTSPLAAALYKFGAEG